MVVVIDFCENKCGFFDIIINNVVGNFVFLLERLLLNVWRIVIDIVLNGIVYVILDLGKCLIKV